jgi:hypothetical protein
MVDAFDKISNSFEIHHLNPGSNEVEGIEALK